MSIQYAQDIAKRLGPGRITLDRTIYEPLAQELALTGMEVRDLGDRPDGGALLADWPIADLRSITAFDTLVLRAGEHERAAIDSALFAAGWRRHAAGMLIGQSGEWNDWRLPQTSYYQRTKASASAGPLRSSGAPADNVIARYALATQFVRPGDHVLVDGVDAGHGIEILAALSRGNRFTASADLPVEVDSPFRLDGLADNSIDLIVALQPPAENWQIALAEYARVLRLDGRIMVGWPAGATDETAPSSWEELTDFAGQLFVPEQRFAQVEGIRALYPIDLAGPNSDWLLLTASAEPLDGATYRDAYTHPGFPVETGAVVPVLLDFGAAYDNPWLYRTMVQMGERLADPIKLATLAEHVIAQARPDSADRGAALSVLGYRVLELRMRDSAPAVLNLIDDYFTATQGGNRPPHVVRWRVSLAFLAGRLCELIEDRAQTLAWYDKAAGDEWSAFSPILATKTIAACFFAGRLCLAHRDVQAATARFQRGVEVAGQVAAADHATAMGGTERPLPFYLQELAEVIDMASQCANALFHMPLFARDPGLYWRQVDVKRFGLASWALDLERENDRLRRQLGR
jgi:hypothetical protein